MQPLLEKARGELPAKAPPPAKKKAESSKPAPKAAAPPPSYDDDEEESRPSSVASKSETKAEKPDLKSKALGKKAGKVRYLWSFNDLFLSFFVFARA